ncbi:MAG: tetratricopeptide repeat protein [Pseudomonadota bacterium]
MALKNIEKSIQKAQKLFSECRYQKALQLAQTALCSCPNHAGLYNFAGACAAQLGKSDLAIQYWNSTLLYEPGHAIAHFNLGLAYHHLQNDQQSEFHYRKAIHYAPDYAEAYCNLGNLLLENEHALEAEHCYKTAFKLNPDLEDACINLGHLLFKQGRENDAAECYQHALKLNATNSHILCNLGIILAHQHHHELAERCYRRAIEVEPMAIEAYCNLALLLEKQNKTFEAEKNLRHALKLNPEHPTLYSNLGNLLTNLLRESEAKLYYECSLVLAPNTAITHSNLGVLWANANDEQRAEASFRQALELEPSHSLARLNLGYLKLSQGKWKEGWAYHESRYVPNSPDKETLFPALPFPQWKGESLANKTLLVWVEQGYGDTLQFCRFLPLLKKMGAKHITLMCREALASLLETLEGDIRIQRYPTDTIPEHNYWSFLLSIPFLLNIELHTLPNKIPYLFTDPKKISYWSSQLSSLPLHSLRVGLVWKGNPHHSNDVQRSLPKLNVLAPLWSLPNISLISLQKGEGEDEAILPPPDQPLLELGSKIKDFTDTAALITLMNLIICVDTSIAHLAGALGKPCWVMLPAYKTDWRWLRERTDSPWYPHTMRLFRQTSRGEWSSVINTVCIALYEEMSHEKSFISTHHYP